MNITFIPSSSCSCILGVPASEVYQKAWQPNPQGNQVPVVSESRVTWATSVPILVFLGFSLFSTQARCMRQTDKRQTLIA